jgi:polysaccharide export outer membrane protein
VYSSTFMRKNSLLNSFVFLFICLLSLNFISCSTNKNIKYFQDIPDSGALKTLEKVEFIEPKIQVDDILSIIIQTVDPLATESINRGNISSASTAMAPNSSTTLQQAIAGYLVNKSGDIDLPIIGKIHVAGLTTGEAKELIYTKTQHFFKDPSVIVRYANFKIVVAGEVAKPSTYVLPNEKVTILEALSMAGDLTIYGKRDNILLLRDNADGSKTPYRINLNKSSILTAPYYYLQQNDYIYVEPSKGKVAANDLSQTKTIAIVGSLLSLLIVIASRVR